MVLQVAQTAEEHDSRGYIQLRHMPAECSIFSAVIIAIVCVHDD